MGLHSDLANVEREIARENLITSNTGENVKQEDTAQEMDELQISCLYYLDTLPLHPQPEHLESLLSYIMRIAEANGIYEIRTLYKLLEIRIDNVKHFGDYSLRFFRKFALRTTCSESRLLATTLHYAGKKFGRSTQSNALSRFFHGSLSDYVRYCPLCLSKSVYYPLTWRFLTLTGCHVHHCRLLDCCGHCGQYIPQFAIPSRVGVCPLCAKELFRYPAEILSQQERKIVKQRITDLEYLLSPQGWEEGDEIARIIGWRFKKIREERQFSIQQTAEALSESVRTIRHLERGTKEKKTPFQLYLRYADYLDITLQIIFTYAFNPPSKHRQKKEAEQERFASNKKEEQTRRQKREHDLLDLVQKALQYFRDLGVPLTINTLCKRIHMTLPNLKTYPSIKSLLDEVSNSLREERRKRRQQLEDEMIEQVEQAVLYLRSCGQVLTEKTIGEYLHRPTDQLRRLPRVNALLKRTLGKAKATSGQPSQIDEDLIINRVCKAIADLKTSGKSVTQKNISNFAGMSLYKLEQFPRVKSILKQVTDDGRLHRRNQSQLHYQEIIERAQKIREQLQVSGQLVTAKEFAELVGLSPHALRHYAQVRPFLSAVIEEYRLNGPQRFLQRESELIEQVHQAMGYLQENGQRVTQQAVGQLVGFSDAGLVYYPGFKRLYQQVMEENRRAIEQQAQRREEMLIESINDAKLQLQQQQKPLTLRNIARMVGMNVNSLRKYPRIDALFKELREDRRCGEE